MAVLPSPPKRVEKVPNVATAYRCSVLLPCCLAALLLGHLSALLLWCLTALLPYRVAALSLWCLVPSLILLPSCLVALVPCCPSAYWPKDPTFILGGRSLYFS
jgi:hypothetical protein